MPLSALDFISLCVSVLLAGREGHVVDDRVALGIAQFGFVAEVSDEDDFVDDTGHAFMCVREDSLSLDHPICHM